MQNRCVYHITLQGKAEEKAVCAAGPVLVKVDRIDAKATRLTVLADQSGLIGLLRFLHQQGFVILSMNRDAGRAPARKRRKYS
jgi:hypothetical protein